MCNSPPILARLDSLGACLVTRVRPIWVQPIPIYMFLADMFADTATDIFGKTSATETNTDIWPIISENEYIYRYFGQNPSISIDI
jgi:hypothetical protein